MAVQTVRQLYELSDEVEVLALLAEIADFVNSEETPKYPRR